MRSTSIKHWPVAAIAGWLCCLQVLAAEQHFIFNNGAEPEYLDPGKASGSAGLTLIAQCFEGLVELHPQTLQPQPGQAARWEISADAHTYTFHLRPDLRWSDGSRLSAEDFRASWLRVLSPATGAKYADQFYPILGAQDFHEGRSNDPTSIGITAPDPQTLVVRLNSPCPWFLELCAFGPFLPVPLAAVAAHDDAWTRAGRMLSNGPFRLREWRERERIVLEKNPHYRDAAAVRLERVTALPHEDLNTAYLQYQAGGLHWLSAIPVGKLEEARRHPDFYTAPYFGSYYYRFNCRKAPFDDARVRIALSRAIDRTPITRDITRLGETPATWYTPKLPGYTPPQGLSFDPAAARQLLKEAGFPDGAGFPVFTILYNESEMHRAIAEGIAQQWKSNLGITVRTRTAEWKSYLKDMDSLNFDVIRSAWIGDYLDPYTFLSCFITDGGNNRTGWGDPAFDQLLVAARQETDAAGRKAIYQRLERILVEEALPIMPIYIYVQKGLVHEDVQNLHMNIRQLLFCKYISMWE